MLAPDRANVDPKLSQWLRDRQDRLYLSAITVAEIEMGVRKLRRSGAHARAGQLSLWLDQLTQEFDERVLAVDATVGRVAGALSEAAIAMGRHPGYADVLIGATARVHDLLLLTANTKHFDAIGVANAHPSRALPD